MDEHDHHLDAMRYAIHMKTHLLPTRRVKPRVAVTLQAATALLVTCALLGFSASAGVGLRTFLIVAIYPVPLALGIAILCYRRSLRH